jgi:hypothetical protein
MDSEFFLSLLSMDAYNRGAGAGVFMPSARLGLATVNQSSDVVLGARAIEVGFSATSYLWNGQT